MDLHIDIILIVIGLLSIPDIRNLIRCDKKRNLLYSKNILSILDINSLAWKNKLNLELRNPIYSKYVNLNNLDIIDLKDFCRK